MFNILMSIYDYIIGILQERQTYASERHVLNTGYYIISASTNVYHDIIEYNMLNYEIINNKYYKRLNWRNNIYIIVL